LFPNGTQPSQLPQNIYSPESSQLLQKYDSGEDGKRRRKRKRISILEKGPYKGLSAEEVLRKVSQEQGTTSQEKKSFSRRKIREKQRSSSEQVEKGNLTMYELPLEIISIILLNSKTRSVVSFISTCKRFKEIDGEFLWEKLFQRDFGTFPPPFFDSWKRAYMETFKVIEININAVIESGCSFVVRIKHPILAKKCIAFPKELWASEHGKKMVGKGENSKIDPSESDWKFEFTTWANCNDGTHHKIEMCCPKCGTPPILFGTKGFKLDEDGRGEINVTPMVVKTHSGRNRQTDVCIEASITKGDVIYRSPLRQLNFRKGESKKRKAIVWA
jgi:hypothetical protein